MKLLCLDVDGVLTDGGLCYGPEGEAVKTFCARDGIAFHWLADLGIPVALISGHDSKALRRRAKDLHIEIVRAPEHDKGMAIAQIAAQLGIALADTVMIGDDLQDIHALKMAGWSACPCDAVPEVRSLVNYVSLVPGGHGAARDIIEASLRRAGLLSVALARYMPY